MELLVKAMGWYAKERIHRGHAPGIPHRPQPRFAPTDGFPYTPPHYQDAAVPHSADDKRKALTRVRRIRGQLDALERALEEGADCAPVLQQLAAVRGAVNGLMSEILESHLREEFAHPASTPEQREAGIDAAVALVRSYLK